MLSYRTRRVLWSVSLFVLFSTILLSTGKIHHKGYNIPASVAPANQSGRPRSAAPNPQASGDSVSVQQETVPQSPENLMATGASLAKLNTAGVALSANDAEPEFQ